MAQACNLSTKEAEARGSLQVQNQLGLQSEFKVRLDGIARPCLKKTKIKKEMNKTKILKGMGM